MELPGDHQARPGPRPLAPCRRISL